MGVIVFQHHEDEGPYMLGEALRDHGLKLKVVKLYAGECVPDPEAGGYEGVEGVVSMGGPMDVGEAGYAEYSWMEKEVEYLRGAVERDLAVVGICLGAQLLGVATGGEVGPMAQPEVGMGRLKMSYAGQNDVVLTGVKWAPMQFHVHGCEVKKMGDGCVVLAGSEPCAVQIYRVGQRAYGFQCHFECSWEVVEMFLEDGLVEKAGADKQVLLEEAREVFEEYRRVGDRIAKNLALYVFGCGG